MITIDTRDIKKLSRQLEVFSSRALPTAVISGLDRAAFETRKQAISNVQESMVIRNPWTRKSIQVTRAKPMPIRYMHSVVGSVAQYMATQESGGSKVASGSEGVPLPTSYSAGQAKGAKPRTRMPRSANRMKNIQLRNNRVPISNQRQRNAIVVKMAAKGKGSKYVFLDLGRRKGIFRVTGTKRSIDVNMVHDLSNKSVVIPRNPWLMPAYERVSQRLQSIMISSMRFEARKLGLFKP